MNNKSTKSPLKGGKKALQDSVGSPLVGPIEGHRRGSSAYYVEGTNYLYKKNKEAGDREYFSCVMTYCAGLGVRKDGQNGLFRITRNHSCRPKSDFIKSHLSKLCMKKRAESEGTELRQIYEEEKSR